MLTHISLTNFKNTTLDLKLKPRLNWIKHTTILDAIFTTLNTSQAINNEDCDDNHSTKLVAVYKGIEICKTCSFTIYNQHLNIPFYRFNINDNKDLTEWFRDADALQQEHTNSLIKPVLRLTGYTGINYEKGGLELIHENGISLSLITAPYELQYLVGLLMGITRTLAQSSHKDGCIFLLDYPEREVSPEFFNAFIATIKSQLTKSQFMITTSRKTP